LLETIGEMTTTSLKYINILVTSRKEKDVTDKLKLLIDPVSLEESVVHADIALHVRERLKNDDELRQWDDDQKKKIEEDLTKGAHGM
jgi:hypothetical protein